MTDLPSATTSAGYRSYDTTVWYTLPDGTLAAPAAPSSGKLRDEDDTAVYGERIAPGIEIDVHVDKEMSLMCSFCGGPVEVHVCGTSTRNNEIAYITVETIHKSCECPVAYFKQ